MIYELIAGPDGRDTETQPVPVEVSPELSLNGLRIALAPNFPGFPLAEEVRAVVVELAAKLARLGGIVEEAPLPELDFNQELRSAGELIGMMVGAFQPQEHEQPASLAQYLEALHRRDRSMIAWEQFFTKWDVLLCPPSMTAAFPHCEIGTPLRIDGQEMVYWMVTAHSTLFNYTGHPAVVLPYRFDREGLPIGVQLVGKRWGEARLLAVAEAVSEVAGGYHRPPGF